MNASARILVIAKAPVAGRSKTRLSPPFTADEAAELAEAALVDTLALAAATVEEADRVGVDAEVVVVLDGSPGPWLPSGTVVVEQVAGSLDVRLAAAFEAGTWSSSGSGGAVPCLLIGMDTPQADPVLLADALRGLADESEPYDGCLGRAADGGWWALGLRRSQPSLLRGLPMSTPSTGSATAARLAEAGLRIRELPVLTDVDTAEDAAVVAGAAPDTVFASVHRRLDRRVQ